MSWWRRAETEAAGAVAIAPSILAADVARLGEEVRAIEAAGADLVHLDVMDGHFVDNLTYGPGVAASVHRVTALPLDCHLMVTDPATYAERFLDNGATCVNVCGSKDALWNVNEWDDYPTSIAEIVNTAGPKTDDYPAAITISYNHMYNMGRFEKQTSGVNLFIAEEITIRRNTIHTCPRAGLNICDGSWGGHIIEFNDVIVGHYLRVGRFAFLPPSSSSGNDTPEPYTVWACRGLAVTCVALTGMVHRTHPVAPVEGGAIPVAVAVGHIPAQVAFTDEFVIRQQGGQFQQLPVVGFLGADDIGAQIGKNPGDVPLAQTPGMTPPLLGGGQKIEGHDPEISVGQ